MTDVTDDHPSTGRATLNASGDRRATAIARLSIGLGQGIILWWLFQAQERCEDVARDRTDAVLAALLLVFAYLPVVLLAGVGRLRLRTLMVWAAVAGATLALLAWHDIARQALEEAIASSRSCCWPSRRRPCSSPII